ncbi:thioredoxin-dependent thiol peroxidase [Terasakiella sp. A23]|uniref:thioredoxin-dependent thiol peroxidase n=1 Tax=Terasakiella sp. FCG-A23 TaxID=3080561 RepID=UPI002954047E|nr:thioredoxin-dependent thiol peroxidase [Terasakiella sp. A23]MDV7339419.1 thioredoxin-dependent thiol peroxidase [Terasakiella sp. A23]
MTLEVGNNAPDFTLPTDNAGELSLSSLKGKKVVLYFYPKDSTPGCTTQAKGFRDHMAEFEAENCVIVGASKDSVKRHDNFKAKQELNFALVSDAESDLCEKYGVWQEKKMYGKTFMGIVRTTFLIDENGVIQKIWPKVKVKDHIEDVLEAVKAL